MAEVHVIGEIQSAYGFPEQRLFCRWELGFGGGWRVIQGVSKGQTQTDLSEYGDFASFSHPLDIHLATKTIQGWPSINLQIWHYDEFGRQELYGYGSIYLPASPGEHQIKCYTWRPKGGLREEMMQHFIGGGLQFTDETSTRLDDHSRLRTVSMGVVRLRISVITKHFDRFGIQC
uniref:B9 domain-containing protein 2 n=1 Tax=Setaria digitata TaxID=48799 RepID=A0A915PIN2_9BILA